MANLLIFTIKKTIIENPCSYSTSYQLKTGLSCFLSMEIGFVLMKFGLDVIFREFVAKYFDLAQSTKRKTQTKKNTLKYNHFVENIYNFASEIFVKISEIFDNCIDYQLVKTGKKK